MQKAIWYLLALLLGISFQPFASATAINSTVLAGNELTITGTGFSGTPLTVTFNGQKIAVASNTSTQIVATINPLPAPGTYRVVVKAGKASATSYVEVSNIVARVSMLGQNAPISPTVLLTPTVNGLYQISVYILISVQNQSDGVWEAEFFWTDDFGPEGCTNPDSPNGPQCVPVATTTSQGGSYKSSTFAVRAVAGSPITYSVSGSGDSGSTYELFITVEQLQ